MTQPELFVQAFVAQLRADAVFLEARGALEAAKTSTQVAADLEVGFRGWQLAQLTIAEAATESGYSQERLRELVRERKIPVARDTPRGRLRIRRVDLPRRTPENVTPMQRYGLEGVARKLRIS